MFPMPSPPLSAVTFDLDGLMFNTEELYQEVGKEILGRRNCLFTEDLIDRMMGRKSPDALQLMIDWHQLDATPAQLAEESAEIFRDLLPLRLAPMPGMLQLIDALDAAAIPFGIATSSGRAFVAAVLGQFNLEPRFRFVLTAENIERGKPAPDVYLLAAERHGVDPQTMLVLEDSPIGCQAAVASAAYAVAVPSGRSRLHRFPGAAFEAESLADARIFRALGIETPLAEDRS